VQAIDQFNFNNQEKQNIYTQEDTNIGRTKHQLPFETNFNLLNSYI